MHPYCTKPGTKYIGALSDAVLCSHSRHVFPVVFSDKCKQEEKETEGTFHFLHRRAALPEMRNVQSSTPWPLPSGRGFWLGEKQCWAATRKRNLWESVSFHSVLSSQWPVASFYFLIQGATSLTLGNRSCPSSFKNSSGECTTRCLDYWGKHLCNSDASTGVKLLIHWDPPFSLIRPVSEGFAETIPETLTLILTNVHLAYFLIFPLNI